MRDTHEENAVVNDTATRAIAKFVSRQTIANISGHGKNQSSRPSPGSAGRAQVRFKNSYVETIIVPHSMALSDLGAMPRHRPLHPSSATSLPADEERMCKHLRMGHAENLTKTHQNVEEAPGEHTGMLPASIRNHHERLEMAFSRSSTYWRSS